MECKTVKRATRTGVALLAAAGVGLAVYAYETSPGTYQRRYLSQLRKDAAAVEKEDDYLFTVEDTILAAVMLSMPRCGNFDHNNKVDRDFRRREDWLHLRLARHGNPEALPRLAEMFRECQARKTGAVNGASPAWISAFVVELLSRGQNDESRGPAPYPYPSRDVAATHLSVKDKEGWPVRENPGELTDYRADFDSWKQYFRKQTHPDWPLVDKGAAATE